MQATTNTNLIPLIIDQILFHYPIVASGYTKDMCEFDILF